jgi:hypothetical protein
MFGSPLQIIIIIIIVIITTSTIIIPFCLSDFAAHRHQLKY